MIVFNFFGGPGSGKSTTAAYVFARLKNKGVRVELAREVAKDMIWEGRGCQLQRNQFLVSAIQYSRLKDLDANGCEVAVTDSPVLAGLAYTTQNYRPELERLLRKVSNEFRNINVLLMRSAPYQFFGRVESESEAQDIDQSMRKLTMFDFVAKGNEEGQTQLFDELWLHLQKNNFVLLNKVNEIR